MTSEGYHEPIELLDDDVMDRHRAIRSIMEELEAVDWYNQRIQVTTDAELAAILPHKGDEEKEKAAKNLNEPLRPCLFTEGDLLEIEDEAEHG